MSDLKPKWPSCDGRQFAQNPYDGHNYLDVAYDEFNNEQAEDRVMHGNATPQHSNPQYVGKHYSEDFRGGYTKSGTDVAPPAVSRENVNVDIHKSDRGKEA